jgi:hypothetical protein
MTAILFIYDEEKGFARLSEAKHLVSCDSSVAALPQNDLRDDVYDVLAFK